MLSIIVPCYNEKDNIPSIIQKFEEAIGQIKELEIILVNNGSTDNSLQVFKKMLKGKKDLFKLIHIPKNQGYGHGILTGLTQTKGDILAWTHADLQTDPKDVFSAYSYYLKQKNNENLVVKGLRKKRKYFEAFFTFGMQCMTFLILKQWLTDINAQPKVFSKNFFLKHIYQKAPLDFSLDLFLLYQAKKIGSIKTIPVYFNKRLYGEAKGGTGFWTRFKLIKHTIVYILSLKKKL